MPKKKSGGGGGPKPGELPVTYADMVTLLLTFFVFLMSMASFDEPRLKDIFATMATAFGFHGASGTGVITGGASFSNDVGEFSTGSEVDSAKNALTTMREGAMVTGKGGTSATTEPTEEEAELESNETTSEVEVSEESVEQFEGLQLELADQPGIDAVMTSQGLKIDLQEQFARFRSGSDQLPPDALPKIREMIANNLQPLIDDGYEIMVIGHTDNVPLGPSTRAKYTDNRGLATARANTMLRVFESLSVDPRQISAAGYGEHKPKADNATTEGRDQNRRIEILVKYKEFSVTDWGEETRTE